MEHARLDPSPGSPGIFGSALDVSGDRLIVGDPGPLLPYRTGNVSIREWNGTNWVQQAVLLPTGSGGPWEFGADVGAVPRRVAVAERVRRQVDVFREDLSGWVEETTFVPEVSNELYAFSIALTPRLLAVGAYPPFSSPTSGGSIYFYGLRQAVGAPCAGSEDCHSGYCVDSVCCESECGGGALDDCMVCGLAAGGMEDGRCVAAPLDLGIVCRPAAESCDLEEACDGVSPDCPSDTFVVAGTPCRETTGGCDVADFCDGSSPICADAFVPDGTGCDDGATCNGGEACVAGVCRMQAPPECDDGDPCTADLCIEPSGCSNSPIRSCGVPDAGAIDAGFGEVVTYGCACRASVAGHREPQLLLWFTVLFLLGRRTRSSRYPTVQ